MIRELWPGCKTVNGRPRHPQRQDSVERVNKEIKKVLGALMHKNNDLYWVKYVPIPQYSHGICIVLSSLNMKYLYHEQDFWSQGGSQ